MNGFSSLGNDEIVGKHWTLTLFPGNTGCHWRVGSVGKGEMLQESVQRAASVEDLLFYLRTSDASGRFTACSFDDPGWFD